jgi:hypothetical protein
MPIYYLFSMLSGIFALTGALILLWRVLRRSEQNIVDDSRTVTGVGHATEKYDLPPSEPMLRRNMIEQADAVAGFLLLATGFLCQLLSALFMLRSAWVMPAWLGIAVIGVVALLSLLGWRLLGDHAVARTQILLRRWSRQ